MDRFTGMRHASSDKDAVLVSIGCALSDEQQSRGSDRLESRWRTEPLIHFTVMIRLPQEFTFLIHTSTSIQSDSSVK